MSKHTAQRLETGIYMYRGYRVEADGCLPSGNDGAWLCTELRISGCTLKDMKRDVDRHIDARGNDNEST